MIGLLLMVSLHITAIIALSVGLMKSENSGSQGVGIVLLYGNVLFAIVQSYRLVLAVS